MAKTKSFRAGDTRIISKDSTDNPKLCEKKMADGRTSLFLEFYRGYRKTIDPQTGKETVRIIREKKSLKLYLYDNPRTADERAHNTNILGLAKKIRYECEQEFLQVGTGYRVHGDTVTDFSQYIKDYYDSYQKKDKPVLKVTIGRFTDFLNDTPKYRLYAKGVQPKQMSREMMRDFAEYLQGRSYGGGAREIFKMFKKVVKYATEHDVFIKNPCDGISIRADESLTKATLTLDEIRTLAGTPFPGRNDEIRRAFLFSLYTGIRFCDVKSLTFGDVDYSRPVLTFNQHKTDGHSAHSIVTIPLNANTLAMIGERRGADEGIFNLPSRNTCLTAIQAWVDAAGIEKHITWHCARHSFAVNVLFSGADIKTVSSLLGHANISMTERYLHAVDERKRAAVDIFPDLNF